VGNGSAPLNNHDTASYFTYQNLVIFTILSRPTEERLRSVMARYWPPELVEGESEEPSFIKMLGVMEEKNVEGRFKELRFFLPCTHHKQVKLREDKAASTFKIRWSWSQQCGKG